MSTETPLAGTLRDELGHLRQAINEMLTQFRKLQSPIRESQEQVPVASRQLRKITAETEAATNRVLDMAEAISMRESELLTRLGVVAERLGQQNPETVRAEIIGCRRLVEQNHEDSFAIMEALQFQDITTQQINHTMDMLQDIENRLGSLVGVMGVHQETESPVPAGPQKKNVAYDPNAEFSLGQTGQRDVDSLVKSFKTKP